MSPDRSENVGRIAVEAQGLREAASRFFPGKHRILAAREIPSGYSGSAFARVETPASLWLLRRWPPGFDKERLRFVHRALSESRRGGFSGVPALAKTEEGESAVCVAGKLYDAQTLLAGEPLVVQSPGLGPVPNVAMRASSGLLGALARTLACFHLSTSTLSPVPVVSAAPLVGRLRDLEAEASRRYGYLGHAVRARAADEDRRIGLGWLALLPRALGAALEAAERLSPGGTGEVLCHADLWPAHVRFEGDSFTGFTDFESLVFANPALDLAQLLGHFGGWKTAGTVLRSYRTVAPLTEEDEASLAPEAVADLTAEGLWALEALYGERSSISPAQKASHKLNLRLLFSPLEKAAGSCRGPTR